MDGKIKEEYESLYKSLLQTKGDVIEILKAQIEVFEQINRLKDKMTHIIKTQNSTLKCVIDCQEKIKKLEKKNG